MARYGKKAKPKKLAAPKPVEASPCDKIWGIGLVEAHARTTPEQYWPGLNLLGMILTQVRDEIRAGDHDEVLQVQALAAESKGEDVAVESKPSRKK